MEVRIETIAAKKLVGKQLTMSFVTDKSHQLWRSFMPSLKLIDNRVNEDLISLQRYNGVLDIENFDPKIEFIKWASTEVSDFANVPEEVQTIEITGGKYAVFIHEGTSGSFGVTFQYIFWNWLPSSDFLLDDREHFEVLGKDYKYNDPSSKEEVWIPIKDKNN
jgi:AraC family transcriptional regulator